MDTIFSPDHEDGFSCEGPEDCLMGRYNCNAELYKLILPDCVNLFQVFEEDVDLLSLMLPGTDGKRNTTQDGDGEFR